MAAIFVRPATACLEATYALQFFTATRPEAEQALTMAPPPFLIMAGMAYFMPSQTPLALTAITASKRLSSNSHNGEKSTSPALLKRMSRRPNVATTRSTMAAT